MSDVLSLVRALRGEVASMPVAHMEHMQSMICTRLDEIEAVIAATQPKPKRDSLLARSLLALADQGEGATPAMLGHALDPSKEGYQAGTLGGNRLNALKQAGLARRAHFGWWVLTEAGQREVEQLRRASAPASGEGAAA